MQQQVLRSEMQLAAEMVRRCIEENALKAQDQTEFLRQYEQYAQRYETLKNEYDGLIACPLLKEAIFSTTGLDGLDHFNTCNSCA